MNKNNSLDQNTFEHLFRNLYPGLLRFCTQIVRNQTIAEDIVQEKFIHLWEKRDEHFIQLSYKSYLYTSVKNKAIDHLRSKYLKSIVSIDEAHTIIDNGNSSQPMEYEEYSKIVTRAVESLPERCFAVFSLKRYGEFSRKEIAQQLNISEKTVDNHLAEATKKIRAFLQNIGYFILLAISLFINHLKL